MCWQRDSLRFKGRASVTVTSREELRRRGHGEVKHLRGQGAWAELREMIFVSIWVVAGPSGPTGLGGRAFPPPASTTTQSDTHPANSPLRLVPSYISPPSPPSPHSPSTMASSSSSSPELLAASAASSSQESSYANFTRAEVFEDLSRCAIQHTSLHGAIFIFV